MTNWGKLLDERHRLAEEEREKNRLSYFHNEELRSIITGKIIEMGLYRFLVQAGEKKFLIKHDSRLIKETPEKMLKQIKLGATIRIEIVRGVVKDINQPQLLSIRAPHKRTVWR